jgi:uncharacterized tellurite resistance protein B-like protein
MSEGQGLSASHFAMWRAVVALVHIDGKVTDDERAMVWRLMTGLNLSPEQHSSLETELEQGVLLEQVLDQITDHRDFSQLIRLATSIFTADHNFDETEQETLGFLKREFSRRFPAYDWAPRAAPPVGGNLIVLWLRRPIVRYLLLALLTMALLYGVLLRRL